MFRRVFLVALLAVLVLLGAACRNKNVKNPLAEVGSKQPDKVLFDRAMDAMQRKRYDVARLSLQTLINTYPDSEFIARAKLAVGDSWYAEGGSAGMAQAENEYKDFITFFPNMPEAAEAQLKVADIHYRQMEKADRDYTHAKRAEDEYRQVLLQYPDSKLADAARKRLLEVQEVLAEREFRIGRFYYMRGSWAAAVARLKSVSDTYPLYSHIDDALFMLGDSLEQQITLLRNAAIPERSKNLLIREYTDKVAEAYGRIITRYPVMGHVEEAKRRLAAIDRPIPKPTEEAIALNTKEQESRGELGRMGKVMLNFHRKPDISTAVKIGEPTLVDPKQTDAAAIVRSANDAIRADLTRPQGAGDGTGTVSVETVKGDKPPENQPVPRSDAPANTGIPELKPTPPATGSTSTTQSPTEVTPAPTQVNDAATDPSAAPSEAKAADSTSKSDAKAETKTESSSKPKKKKGLRKLIPF
ncbi:MAG TPA: outer membrane protein assembly factor BamD [Clostridia bacterium]|nr:outer membrane protein assembly factor BamD [Clostridia bacterium]